MNTIFVHSTMNIIFVYSFLCQLHFLNYVISCFLSSLRGHIICEGSNEVGCFWKVLRFFFLCQCLLCMGVSPVAVRYKPCCSRSPMTMDWGSLWTPTPALVLAATSTRYSTPACRPPTTTERMAASTVLFTWKRVSFPKHQI